MATRFAFALNALLFATAPVDALPRRLPPIEQCSGDRSFVAFRNSLKQVVARKDRDAILKMLAPDVLVNFGGGTGREAFASEWSFDPEESGNLWSALATMLSMGCARDGGSRIIPSLPMQVDQDSEREWGVALPGAKLYREAGVESANPAIDPWTVVTVTSRASDTMTGVMLPDGRDGFVADDLVYEPASYRMIVEKRGVRWMITAFVAGD